MSKSQPLNHFLPDLQKTVEDLRAVIAELRELSAKLAHPVFSVQSGEASQVFQVSDIQTPEGQPLTTQQTQMLSMLADLQAAGVFGIPRPWLALALGFAWPSGKFNTNISVLCKAHLVNLPGKKLVGLTPAAANKIPNNGGEFSLSRVVRRAYDTMERQSADILSFLSQGEVRQWAQRDAIAAGVGQSKKSGSFRERLTELQNDGFLEFNRDGGVRLALHWLPDSALKVEESTGE